MKKLRKLYNPESGIMRICGFISEKGRNLVQIIEHAKEVEHKTGKIPYEVVSIFSENKNSNARKIGLDYGIPAHIEDLEDFCRAKGKEKKDMKTREEFDSYTLDKFKFHVDVVALARYNSMVTLPILRAFLTVNVHSNNLSIVSEGKKVYAGDEIKSIKKALKNGEKELRATTHLASQKAYYGNILMISKALPINKDEDFDFKNQGLLDQKAAELQDALKAIGDWDIFPKTLEYMANGRYAMDEKNNLYFDDNPIPNGVIIN